jgi:ribosomal protein S21
VSVNAEVVKNEGESAINLIRRFSKRVQGAQIITRMRANRYHARIKSRSVQRKQALKLIRRRQEVQELIKMGKMLERAPRGGRGGPRRR